MEGLVPRHLAQNLRRLREERGLTQQSAAELSGVPRPTWATLESGSANPTLTVLMRAAAALGVSIEELIRAPRAAGTVHRVGSLRSQRRGGVVVRQLLPGGAGATSLDRLELGGGGALPAAPHEAGFAEYLACESGALEVEVSSDTFALGPGDVLAFRSDTRFTVRSRDGAVAYRLVLVAPVGA